jgi:hypothetical protein
MLKVESTLKQRVPVLQKRRLRLADLASHDVVKSEGSRMACTGSHFARLSQERFWNRCLIVQFVNILPVMHSQSVRTLAVAIPSCPFIQSFLSLLTCERT